MSSEKRGRGRAPSLRLSDGTPLLAAIQERGLNRVTVYSRIRRGLSPDEAVAVDALPKGRPPVMHLSDGRALVDAIRDDGVSRRCVYYAVKSGMTPDAAFASVLDRKRNAAARRAYFRARRGLSD